MEGGTSSASSSPPSLSLVTDYGPGASTCGYCGAKGDIHWSHGMQAEFMTVETYPALLDRGWRRSGRWIYKPLHSRTCCQLITIRLDVEKFQPTKDQRRVQRRWEAHLAGAPLKQTPPAPHDDDHVVVVAPAAAAPTVWNGRQELQGASPKRMREESDDVDGWSSYEKELQGGGKRQRSVHNLEAMDDIAATGGDLGRAASPTAELSEQLQFALGAKYTTPPLDSDGVEIHVGLNHFNYCIDVAADVENKTARAFSSSPQKPSASPGLEKELANALQDALKRCIDSGQLPDLDYPLPRVSQPTSKQRKRLPSGVAYTSPTPLAVAGVASRAENGGEKGTRVSPRGTVAPTLSAKATAELILENMQLPSGVQGADVANGHLNFKADAAAAIDIAPPEAPPLRVSSKPPVSHFAGLSARKESEEKIARTVEQQQTLGVSTIPRSVPRQFELVLLPSSEASLPAMEFELYKKYQVMHHGDSPNSVTRTSFHRFLCDSPLLPSPASAYPQGGAPSCGFGSFHQQYWLDGRLIAVGVVDILPHALSSKYFFWDPDLAPLSLGKVASLQEIAWVRAAHATCPSLRYYYLGYYLDNCHRMRYKAEFGPSDLLCPVKQCWVPIERAKAAVASNAHPPVLADVPGALEGLGEDYLVTAEGQPAVPPRQPTLDEVDEVKLFVGVERGGRGRRGQVFTFGTLRALGLLNSGMEARMQRRLEEWMMLAGPAWRSIVYSFE